MAKIGPRERITISEIAATDVTLTIEGQNSVCWRRSASLAAEIANDPGFQQLVRGVMRSVQSDDGFAEIAARINQKGEYVVQKFGGRPYYDSGVAQAASIAVMGTLRRRKVA